ncbi:MAG: type II toxin-antitoxin system VapC family toxin [Deltaproteobacteria bacterium]|nr:type II toxin-antitoxin system VapC family toxin [Deltaproteobacteria bacterium]
MKLLLDTHVLLWALGRPQRIRAETRRRIEQPDHLVFVSVVSAWELEIKRALGKLRAPPDLAAQLTRLRFTELPVRLRHVDALRDLPPLHRDPFDRMLVAQAVADGLTLVTADDRLRAYDVTTMGA